MKTADPTGALLDYWTARAEGVPADELSFAGMTWSETESCNPRLPTKFCIRRKLRWAGASHERLDYSTNWVMGGPLLDDHHMWLSDDGEGVVYASKMPHVGEAIQEGDTPLIAICRAVVRAAFGDEVENLP